LHKKGFIVLRLFKSKAPMVGIDISSTSVKLLELKQRGEHYEVESYAAVAVPSGAVIEKEIKDGPVLAETIAKALAQSKSKAKYAALALPDSSVIRKVIALDKTLTDDEMEMQVMIQADKFIPYPLSEVRIDFDVVGQSEDNPTCVDVVVVASRAEKVQQRINALVDSGLEVKVVDVESYAIERACRLVTNVLPAYGQDQLIAVLDIGARTTSLNVLYNLTSVFNREESFGGEQLIKAIQRQYNLSYEEAVNAQRTTDLAENYNEAVLKPFMETTVLHTRRALQIFFSSSSYSKVNHILLAGSTPHLPEVAQSLSAQLGVETSLVDPFSNMPIAAQVDKEALFESAAGLMMCCGLAMRGGDE
jgi:type IV pilus assembly protein PilM